MSVLGYVAALIIGVVLGLIGAGGSILTIPVLVYLLDIDPILATGYSLFIVGIASLFGFIGKYRDGLVSVKTAILFAIPALIAVYLTRLLVIPALPKVIYSFDNYIITREMAIMVLFGVLMLMSSLLMIGNHKEHYSEESPPDDFKKYSLILIEGLVVGILTGLVGAGGGFLIIPVLVLLGGLSMKVAVGTSMLIVTIKSLIGFIGDIQVGQNIDWTFLLLFSGIAIVGIFIGNKLTHYTSSQKLKKSFGWFVLIMSIYILTRELLFNNSI